MNETVFAGNLTWTLQEDELRAAFEAFGPVVSCRILEDRDSGHSRGYGFVEMKDADAARRAIVGLDGRLLKSRPLRCALATAGPYERGHGVGPDDDIQSIKGEEA
jgi:RNA recognition motif-containing protein